MEIRKHYDIKQLKETLKDKIEKARGCRTGAALIDVIIAQEILEVLEETYRREQKAEHSGCSGKYDEDNLDCLKCACGDECMKETYEARGRNK